MACDPLSYEKTRANGTEVKYNRNKQFLQKIWIQVNKKPHIGGYRGGYIGLQIAGVTSRIMLINKMLQL